MVRYALWAGDDASSNPAYLIIVGGDNGVVIIINYTLKHCPNMEVHISTQAGIKDLYDVSFFKDLNVDRCVIAREASIDEIKKIKEKIDMPIEVFMHGALCVSYSGGCLFSSMLTLRSGNRGRCAQNCRREYSLYKDDNLKLCLYIQILIID